MAASLPHRVAYAEDPAASRGRKFEEAESATRTPFARDRDRIIHATSSRRLKGKTQGFLAGEGDHSRTRLTHTIEVAQLARTVLTVTSAGPVLRPVTAVVPQATMSGATPRAAQIFDR